LLIDQIILTGYVVNTDLPAIYSQCDVFYIHRLESFIPMLEAMSCNIPVITSNTSSMPEVFVSGTHSQSIQFRRNHSRAYKNSE
jgi:glycosyltransferase involved in cell wall biosynthesis